jgi:hypothetical protein
MQHDGRMGLRGVGWVGREFWFVVHFHGSRKGMS